jgi:hypothetical protein
VISLPVLLHHPRFLYYILPLFILLALLVRLFLQDTQKVHFWRTTRTKNAFYKSSPPASASMRVWHNKCNPNFAKIPSQVRILYVCALTHVFPSEYLLAAAAIDVCYSVETSSQVAIFLWTESHINTAQQAQPSLLWRPSCFFTTFRTDDQSVRRALSTEGLGSQIFIRSEGAKSLVCKQSTIWNKRKPLMRKQSKVSMRLRHFYTFCLRVVGT